MAELLIKKLNIENASERLEEVSKLLEKSTEKTAISTINWKEYAYLPDVKFRIAHTDSEIILKFYIIEKNPKAIATKINGDVYKDSCVEFFLSPKSDGFYYNFEFNCIGTTHLAYGENRHNRQLIDNETIGSIKAVSTLGSKPIDLKGKNTEWDILVIIPKSTMVNSAPINWNGLAAKGNFYKCGDETEEMHFVTWNLIETQNPDYHQYQFFGNLFFE